MLAPFHPLETWNSHWVIQGPRLRCRLCGASQDLTDCNAFSHSHDCPLWGRQAQYPCSELAEILRQENQAGLI